MKQKPKSSPDGRAESSKLGTFGGVFTPSVLFNDTATTEIYTE